MLNELIKEFPYKTVMLYIYGGIMLLWIDHE